MDAQSGCRQFLSAPGFFPIMKSRRTLYLTACGLLAAAVVAVNYALDERHVAASATQPSANAPADTRSAITRTLPLSRDLPARSQARSQQRGLIVERSAAEPVAKDRPASRAPLWQQWHRRQSTPEGTHAIVAKTAIHHPAVWVDLGDQSMLTFSQQADLQQAAESLQQRLEETNLPLDSADYRARWQAEVEQSDQLFRQRYGGYAWHRHHVQAYHLGAGNSASTR